MIIKQGQTVKGLEMYVRNTRYIFAKRMDEDFLIENGKGWAQGHRGDWLVRVEDELWTVIEDAQFRKIYRPYMPGGDCVGPCELFHVERRIAKEDALPCQGDRRSIRR